MKSKLKKSINDACSWLTKTAQIRNNLPPGSHAAKMPVEFWNGAIKGEYMAADKSWDAFCPIWHTGQAVKALVMASDALNKPELLVDAELSAEFIMRNRLTAGDDKGLVLAFEDFADKINTSAVLEALDGLFFIYKATGNSAYGNAAIQALEWCAAKAYTGNGSFMDLYDYRNKRFIENPFGICKGRPLLEDGVFLTGWKQTGWRKFREIALDTAEKLLTDEKPSGNWIKYGPCKKHRGSIHPRHAYWWGKPMLEVYKATGDERFLKCFSRSIEWYKRAMRKDGGFFRNTYNDFKTDSFGHATSGTACAVICFLNYYEHTRDRKVLKYIRKGLDYCMSMQFTKPEDPNLKGVILEKIQPPDGSDRSPYQIRDLGTIFFIQAASIALRILSGKVTNKKYQLV